MNLKNQIRLYLELRDITAAQLARKAGVSKQLISLWLAGSPPKNISQVKKVATALGTTIDNLVFGEGETNIGHHVGAPSDSIPQKAWVAGVFEIKFRRLGTKRG